MEWLDRIDLPDMLRGIVARFGISLGAAAKPRYLSTIIFPVTDADELLVTPKVTSGPLNLTGASGLVALGTVPVGKRWTLKGYHRAATTGNSQAVIKVGGQTYRAQPLSTSALAENNLDFKMLQGDSVGMEASGNAGDSTIIMYIYYLEYDAF